MIRFAENLNKMITAGLGGALEAPRTEVAVGHCIRYLEASGPVASFESNIAAPIRNLRVDMHPIQAGSGDPSPENIRPITGWDSVTVWRGAVYDPSADPALTIQLGQTVYGGTLDVVSGVLTVDRAMVTYDGSEMWVVNSRNKPWLLATPAPENLKQGNALSLYVKKSNMFKPTSEIWGYPVYGVLNNYQSILVGYPDANGDANVLKSFLSSNPMQLVYELATPLEITLDPATMSTLKGQNNVWSDAGDVTLEYPYYEETEGY